MTEKQQYLVDTLKSLGFNTESKSFESCVENLIQEHIKVLMEIETENKKLIKTPLNLN
jgi:hypothetical protein